MGRSRVFKLQYKKNKLIDKVECKRYEIPCGMAISNNELIINEPIINPVRITGKPAWSYD